MERYPERKNIRLKDYDYSQAGYYFITICSQERHQLFGKIINGELILNSRGEMIREWINQIENKFSNIRIDKYVIMPNHIHLIIIIKTSSFLDILDTDQHFKKVGQTYVSARVKTKQRKVDT